MSVSEINPLISQAEKARQYIDIELRKLSDDNDPSWARLESAIASIDDAIESLYQLQRQLA